VPELDREAFWRLIDRSAGSGACWPWTGARTADGYGLVHAGGQTLRAHRVAWELAGYGVPAGGTLDHVCRTRACCNPWHLTVLSRAEHARRGQRRGRFDVLAPAPILDEHARRVAGYLNEHGPAEAAVLASVLGIPIRTLRQRHMGERLQARYGIRGQRCNGRLMFLPAPREQVVAC
jgi:hypothetical protein